MGKDAAPVILEGLRIFDEWADTAADADTGEPLPRAVGEIRCEMRGLPMVRFAGTYAPYLAQRVYDCYHTMDSTDRERADDALKGTGWEPVLASTPRHRVIKRGFDLHLDRNDAVEERK